MIEWTEVILIVGMAAIVPLGMALVDRDGVDTPHIHELRRLQPLAMVPAALSFAVDAGAVAAVLTVPWLVFTLGAAMVGIGRALSRPTAATRLIGIDAGLAFLAVGGVWLTLSRFGAQPMGFDDVIVRLTAVHFHYAGFALPIVASLVTRPGGRSHLLPWATIVAVPLTALGIIVGGPVEWVTATTMAVVGLTVAGRLVSLGRTQAGVARGLLLTAGASLMLGMCLAIAYAWFVFFEIDGLTIDRMARTHGSLNAFGFGLLALIGLRFVDTQTERAEPAPPAGAWPRGTTMAVGRFADGIASGLVTDDDRPATVDATRAAGGARTDRWRAPIPVEHFDDAIARLRTWAGHEAAGIERLPEQPAIEPGATIAMAIPVGPLRVTATCRIVDVDDHPDRFAFTYATLPHHVVEGVETFAVWRDDRGAWVDVEAVWRPLALAARLAPPLTRHLQGRAINRFLQGIAGGPSKRAPRLEVAP